MFNVHKNIIKKVAECTKKQCQEGNKLNNAQKYLCNNSEYSDLQTKYLIVKSKSSKTNN